MTTPSNAVPDSSFESQAVASAALAETRPLYWSVRRELWENRAIYIGPLAVAAVFLSGFFLSTVCLPQRTRALSALDAAHQHEGMVRPFDFAAGLIMLIAFVVSVFYALDALYGERRDRSILFWKSLPVSDLTTVLSKVCILLIVLPLFSFALTVVTQLIMLVWSSVVLLGSGLSAATLWTQVSLPQISVMLLYHLLTVHVLWYAPIYAWLLLASAWARRAPFLWAVLPPVAIFALEKILFNTSHFAHFIGYRFGGPEAFTFPSKMTMPMDSITSLDPVKFFTTPGLWLGLVAAAVFLALAVRLRRYREPS